MISGASEKELDIANARADLLFEIRELKQENEQLKKQYSKLEEKYFNNIPCCNEDDCDLYKDYLNNKNILTEFEKWIEDKKKIVNKKYRENEFANGFLKALELSLYELQKLKEGNNEKDKN